MKQCRRCNEQGLDIIRESIVRRDPRTYLVCWYRCVACGDVSFGYRLFPASAETERTGQPADIDRGNSTAEDPPKSDSPLSV